MDRNAIAAARAELESIIRDSWKIARESGDPRDVEIARTVEAKCRELLALLPSRPKRKKSNKALKRKAFKRCIHLDANAPILAQARAIVR